MNLFLLSLVSCDYDILLAKTNFFIMLTLARTSHRPVRYTDASGILRNADCERNRQGKMKYSRFAGLHHSVLHKSEKYVDYTFDYIF